MKYLTLILIALLLPLTVVADIQSVPLQYDTVTGNTTLYPNLVSPIQKLTASYASTTATTATSICLTLDSCRTTWPSAGGGAYPFVPTTNYGVTTQATTGIPWFQNGLTSSSTAHFSTAEVNQGLTVTTTDSGSGATVADLTAPLGTTIFGIRLQGFYTDGMRFDGAYKTTDASINNFFAFEDNSNFAPTLANKSIWSFSSSPAVSGNQHISKVYGLVGGPFTAPSGSTYTSTADSVELVRPELTWSSGAAVEANAFHAVFNSANNIGTIRGLKIDDVTIASSSNISIQTGLGKLLFGTSTPYAKLTVWGESSTGQLANFVSNASSSLMTILNNGNIGVGTSTPYATSSIQSNSSTGDAFVIATSTGATITGIDNDGHRFTSGPSPTVANCGVGASVTGDDQGGVITTGASVLSCDLNLAKTYRSSEYCTVSANSATGYAYIKSIGTGKIIIGLSASITASIHYSCAYHR